MSRCRVARVHPQRSKVLGRAQAIGIEVLEPSSYTVSGDDNQGGKIPAAAQNE
jgi:hypothetical protein